METTDEQKDIVEQIIQITQTGRQVKTHLQRAAFPFR